MNYIDIGNNTKIITNNDSDEIAYTDNDLKINVKGKNNIIYIEQPNKFHDCTINFYGDNNVIFIGKQSKHDYNFNIEIRNNQYVYLGGETYFNGKLNMILSEHQGIIIGKDCLFSYGCTIRTADPHLIYDIKSKKRTNYSKSVIIGDHVWVGQGCLILKDTKIGSGSIVAGGTVGKLVCNSNSIIGGNPGKEFKKGVVWDGKSVHAWKENNTEKNGTVKIEMLERNTYKTNYTFQDLNKIDNDLKKYLKQTNEDCYGLIEAMKEFHEKSDKNRLAVCNEIKERNNKIKGLGLLLKRIICKK
ncbi:MAG: acyltransferase [Lachnospiraceae bacterium]|jgi:acetyltransferase-like isoleucine patch superfamily enzyme|nr:acyltransferase [Lachnospiraceae bacterium]